MSYKLSYQLVAPPSTTSIRLCPLFSIILIFRIKQYITSTCTNNQGNKIQKSLYIKLSAFPKRFQQPISTIPKSVEITATKLGFFLLQIHNYSSKYDIMKYCHISKRLFFSFKNYINTIYLNFKTKIKYS